LLAACVPQGLHVEIGASAGYLSGELKF